MTFVSRAFIIYSMNDWELFCRCIKAMAQENGRKLRRRERALERQVTTQFKKQGEEVLKEWRKIMPSKGFELKSVSKKVDQIFANLGDSEMIEVIGVSRKGAMKFGADYRIRKERLAKIGISFSLGHPLAEEYLTQYALIDAKLKQTTKAHLKPILINAANTGQSYTDTAKDIMDNFALSQGRAQMIAVHEIGSAYQYGNFIPLHDVQAKGYTVNKHWSTVNDDRVTEECRENEDAGWLSLDDEFPSGDLTAPRSDHPRCRCSVYYQTES